MREQTTMILPWSRTGRKHGVSHKRERPINAGISQFILRSIIILILLSTLPLSFAANDPGHDTLYIEVVGQQNLTGSFNISDWLRVANLMYSDYLDILGNGTQPTGSYAQIYTPSVGTQLVLNAPTSIWLAKDSGSMVHVGDGGAVVLNVSGDIYSGGELVCLADGTNCAAGNNSGNVSSIIAGNGISVDQATGDVNISTSASTCGGSQYSYWTGSGWNCRDDENSGGSVTSVTAGTGLTGGEITGSGTIAANTSYLQRKVSSCSAGQAIQEVNTDGSVNCTSISDSSSAGGWTNTSTLISSNVGDNITMDSGLVFVDATHNMIGIGTTDPNSTLHVAGDINVTTGNDICISGGNCLTSMATDQVGAVSDGQWCRGDGALVQCDQSAPDTSSTNEIQNLTEILIEGNSAGATNINMNNQLIQNIGTTGTDFTSGGGLNLAGTLAVVGAGPHTIATSLNVATNSLFVNGSSVGIGTAQPNSTLHVVGDVNVTGTDNCIYLPNGGKLCGNSTCIYLTSPDGGTTVETCN